MRHNKRIAVVVPAYNEETQIEQVITTMPDFVDEIVVVDDVSTDRTRELVRASAAHDPRVTLLEHATNRGVGAAIVTGYQHALASGADVVAVMAGDAQMPPDELAGIVDPVATDECDYAKANRLARGDAWRIIPRKRYLGNAGLSALTKIASGYYNVVDSQTGYTAISADMLGRIDLDAMYPRYGYPNDMLVRLNVERARVMDIPSRPVYGVGEVSGLKIQRVLFTMSWLLFKRFWWRLVTLYLVRDFHPLALFFVLGSLLLTVGLAGGVVLAVLAFTDHTVTGSTAVVDSLAIQSGLLLVLFAMLFDFEHNRHLTASRRRGPGA